MRLPFLPFSSPLDLRVVEQEDYIASEYQPVPAVFRAAVREYRGRLPHVFVNRRMAYTEQFSCRHHRIQQIGDYPLKIRAHEELSEDRDELLESDPFRKEAIPLYQVITNYLKENDVTFVNI